MEAVLRDGDESMNYLPRTLKICPEAGGGVRAWFGDLANLPGRHLVIYAEGGHSETRASKMHLISYRRPARPAPCNYSECGSPKHDSILIGGST